MTEIATQTGQDIVFIPFNKLVASPINVRKVNPSNTSDKLLLASLKAEGVLQNLIVHSVKRGKFAVCAGGRRFAGLTVLHERNEIPGDLPVPCKVAKDEEQALSWSLHENRGREDMHPADEFEAFAKLEKANKTHKQIAAEFGVSPKYVKQVLALAHVSPVLIEVFRDGKLGLEHMEAFAVTQDHDKQLDTFKALKGYQLNPTNIRRALVGEAIDSSHRLVKYIGLNAYKKAGGALTTDLFQSVTYLNDAELVHRLAQEAMGGEVEAIQAEGWKWVEVDLTTTYANHTDYACRLDADYADTVEANALVDALKAAEADMDALQAKDYDQWTDEDQDRENALSEHIDALEEQLDGHRAFTEEQREMAGVVVYINREGKLEAVRGYVKREDVKAIRAAEKKVEGGEADQSATAPVESQKLSQDLSGYLTQAMQAELLKHAGLCNDLLVFTLADQFLNDVHWSKAVNVRIERVTFTPQDVDETTSASLLAEARHALDLSWAAVEDRGDRFAAFSALSAKKKQHIMAYCVASTYQNHAELGATLSGATGFDLCNYWNPTADNYFRRIKADALLDIGREVIGNEWAEANGKAKKGDLVQALAGAEQIQNWLPESVR